jgi:transcriptional regulator with XRE-family HTH domain
MGVGQRLKRAMERRGVTQVEVAERTGMGAKDISNILREKRMPKFDTVERIVAAIDVRWGELFDEPNALLPDEDAAIFEDAVPALERLLKNDKAQKALLTRPRERRPPRPRRRRKAGLSEELDFRDGTPIHEVEPIPDGRIPEWAIRLGANGRPYRVRTDSMTGVGLRPDAEIYVQHTIYTDGADDQIVICKLNGSTFLKRLDLRGGQKVLLSENPAYSELTVRDRDRFEMVGIVVLP